MRFIRTGYPVLVWAASALVLGICSGAILYFVYDIATFVSNFVSNVVDYIRSSPEPDWTLLEYGQWDIQWLYGVIHLGAAWGMLYACCIGGALLLLRRWLPTRYALVVAAGLCLILSYAIPYESYSEFSYQLSAILGWYYLPPVLQFALFGWLAFTLPRGLDRRAHNQPGVASTAGPAEARATDRPHAWTQRAWSRSCLRFGVRLGAVLSFGYTAFGYAAIIAVEFGNLMIGVATLVYGVVIGVLPSMLLGALTAWWIGRFLWASKERLRLDSAVFAGFAFCVAVAFIIDRTMTNVFPLLSWENKFDLPGLPFTIYALAGAWTGARLFQRLTAGLPAAAVDA